VLIAAVRRQSPVFRVPWWWWLANGLSLVGVSIGNTSGLQGVCAVAGLLSVGVGLTLLSAGLKQGEIRLSRPKPKSSYYDHLGAQDWHAGSDLVRVESALPDFSGLHMQNPYLDVEIHLLGLNVHQAKLRPDELSGRIEMANPRGEFESLAHPPEIQQYAHVTPGGRIEPQSNTWSVPRNKEVALTLRQHLLPAVRDALVEQAGAAAVAFRFDKVNVMIAFERPSSSGHFEPGPSTRLHLQTYEFDVPKEFGRWPSGCC
jgi:hypothetical protein